MISGQRLCGAFFPYHRAAFRRRARGGMPAIAHRPRMLRRLFALGWPAATVAIVGCSAPSPKSADVPTLSTDRLIRRDSKMFPWIKRPRQGCSHPGRARPTDSDKAQAESIAKSMAGGQVISNQIAVLPPGAGSTTKTVNSDLDKGIGENLHAALIQNGLDKSVKYDVKNGVITLTGEVPTRAMRAPGPECCVHSSEHASGNE